MSNKVTQELEFEIDYGVITAKVWNKPTKGCKKILAIHGWMDNAGSFDKLLPLLEHPNGVYVLAIDLPGHGKSSKLPNNAPYSDLHFISAIRYFVRSVGWNKKSHSKTKFEDEATMKLTIDENKTNDDDDKYILLGHSLGGGLATWYACFFPEDIEQLILLDFLKSPTLPTSGLLQQLATNIDILLQRFPDAISSEEKATASKDNIIYAIIYEHEAFSQAHLERDDAMCLFARCSVPVPDKPDKFYLISEPKLGIMLDYHDHIEFMKNMGNGLSCHCVQIMAKRGLYNPRKKDFLTADFNCLKDCMAASCKTFHSVWLNYCDHNLHMNNSGDVAAIINDALLEPGSLDTV